MGDENRHAVDALQITALVPELNPYLKRLLLHLAKFPVGCFVLSLKKVSKSQETSHSEAERTKRGLGISVTPDRPFPPHSQRITRYASATWEAYLNWRAPNMRVIVSTTAQNNKSAASIWLVDWHSGCLLLHFASPYQRCYATLKIVRFRICLLCAVLCPPLQFRGSKDSHRPRLAPLPTGMRLRDRRIHI